MMMLQVRSGKTVYDDKGNVLGSAGALLSMDAPIRDSDRSKVVAVKLDAAPEVVSDAQDDPSDMETP